MGDDNKPPRRRHPALDVQIPFFIPLWRRIATFAVVAFWFAIEVWNGSYTWAALAGGIGIYVGYQFFVAFDPRDEE